MKIPLKKLVQNSFQPYGRILLPQQGETPEVIEKGIFPLPSSQRDGRLAIF